MDREKIYIHCKDNQSFRDYQNGNSEYECIQIVDEYFLRGRWPARIIILDDAAQHLNHQAILESVVIHQELWKEHLVSLEEKRDLSQEKDESGKPSENEDFYGV